MIYNLVQADEVVARLDNDFNINQGDYISRIPQWIYQCLRDLRIHLGIVSKAYVADIENYSCELPTDIENLIGIEYNGCRLDRRAGGQYKFINSSSTTKTIISTNVGVTLTGSNVEVSDDLSSINMDVSKIRTYDSSSINELPVSNEYYYLIPNGKIETSFETTQSKPK